MSPSMISVPLWELSISSDTAPSARLVLTLVKDMPAVLASRYTLMASELLLPFTTAALTFTVSPGLA